MKLTAQSIRDAKKVQDSQDPVFSKIFLDKYGVTASQVEREAAARMAEVMAGLENIGFESWGKLAVHDLRKDGHPAKADAIELLLNLLQGEKV